MAKKKKVLFVANHKGFSKFNAPYMQWFQEQGWQVDNASPGIMVDCVDNHYDIDIKRSPFSTKNIKAYFNLKDLIEKNQYDIVHVHTPMGAFLGRLAARASRRKGCKVIYTAHGFNFYHGAPLKSWLIYYSIEKLLSKSMDALVTINHEDFERARKVGFANGKVFHIDGVGVNLKRFHPVNEKKKFEIREKLGLTKDQFVMLYVGQFTPNKNHKLIISTFPEILKKIPNAVLVCVGGGPTLEDCRQYAAELGVDKNIKFLGFRQDVDELCAMSDIHVSSSNREGLAINNIEAMASGCPLVISDIRGHIEVCINGRNGFLYDLDKPQEFIENVVKLANDSELRASISQTNVKDANKFSVEKEVEAMAEIYKKFM